MYLGQLVEVGVTAEVFADANDAYTRSLLIAVPQVRRDPPMNRLRLAGEPPSALSRPSGCVSSAMSPGRRAMRAGGNRPSFG